MRSLHRQRGWVGALIGAVGALAGGAMSQENSQDEARANREFQENMAKSRHQWETQDMMAAGLNPILSANSGASVPSGSMAANVGDIISPAIATAMQVRRNEAELDLIKENADKARAEAAKERQQVFESQSREQNINQQTRNLVEENLNISAALPNLRLLPARTAAETGRFGSARALDIARIDEAYKHGNVMDQEIERMKADIAEKMQAIKLMAAQTTNSAAHSRLLGREADVLDTRMPGLRFEQRMDESKYGEATRALDRLNPLSNSARNATQAYRNSQSRDSGAGYRGSSRR